MNCRIAAIWPGLRRSDHTSYRFAACSRWARICLLAKRSRKAGTTGLSASHTPKNSPLVPIADHHSDIGPGFASHRCDAHSVVDVIYDVVFPEPITRLP